MTSEDALESLALEATSFPMTEDSASSSARTTNEAPPKLKKFHHLSVCMVPPEASEKVWEMITKCRTELQDPGLFRWPPHANLLYPFFDVRPNRINGDDEGNDVMGDSPAVNLDIIEGLVAACCQCQPFEIRLQQFGTFGGRKRGVLWLHPDSRNPGDVDDDSVVPPLIRLQSLLVDSFPTCNDQNAKSIEGFNPHMTLSHFINLDDALAAQKRVEEWWPTDLSFPVDCIYLLHRSGDSGQFLRVADISLGQGAKATAAIVHKTPIPFRHMPETEAELVLEERMKLKKRRNGKGRGADRSRSWNERNRIKDSPELIEAKREARKAKREGKAVDDDMAM